MRTGKIAAVVVAAVLTACSQAPTAHTMSSSGPSTVVVATPTPLPSLSASAVKASSTLRPVTAGAVSWSARVYLVVLDRYHQRLEIHVVDANGVQQPATFNVTLALGATACCPDWSKPPFITTMHYHGCCTPEAMPVNLQWGGGWGLAGTVTLWGRVQSVSASGPVP